MKALLFLRCIFARLVLSLADWLDDEVFERANRFSTKARPGHDESNNSPNRLPSGRS